MNFIMDQFQDQVSWIYICHIKLLGMGLEGQNKYTGGAVESFPHLQILPLPSAFVLPSVSSQLSYMTKPNMATTAERIWGWMGRPRGVGSALGIQAACKLEGELEKQTLAQPPFSFSS